MLTLYLVTSHIVYPFTKKHLTSGYAWSNIGKYLANDMSSFFFQIEVEARFQKTYWYDA